MKRRRSILALGLGVAADAVLGCSSDAPESAPASSAAPLPSAPVPPGLFGIGVVPAPATVFQLCRDSYDLPVTGSSWASFVVGLSGIPITASEAFDLAGHVRVVLLGPADGQSAGAAVALPLRAPDRLIAVATLGDSARFRSQKDEALLGERLTPTGASGPLELGVLRNHLVVGSAGTLARAGAFLSDPDQPLFARSSLQISGWVHGAALTWLLRSRLDRVAAGPPDLLRAVVPEIGNLERALASMPEIPFELSLTEAMASLRLAAPKSEALGASLASLGTGPLAPVLGSDRDAAIAIGLYQPQAVRVKAAERLGELLAAFGAASQPGEGVRDALVALARACADGFRLAIERGPAGSLAYGSCDIEDEDAARAALSALTKASGEPKNGLGTTIGIIDTRLTLIGEAVQVYVDREEPGKDAAAEPSKKRLGSVLMRIESGRLALATGSDSPSALKKALLRRADEGPAALADLSVVKAILSSLPAQAALHLFVDPARWLSEARPSGDPERDRSALGLAVEVSDLVTFTLALEKVALRTLAQTLQGTL